MNKAIRILTETTTPKAPKINFPFEFSLFSCKV